VTTLEELIHEADPALGVDVPSGTSPRAQWSYPRPTARRPTAVKRRKQLLGAGAIGLIGVAALVTTLLVAPETSPPPYSAAEFLHASADLVASRPVLVPTPGQYLYVEQESQYQVSVYEPGSGSSNVDLAAVAQYGETESTWVNAQGNSTEQQNRTALSWPSAADQQAWETNPGAQTFSATYRQSVTEPTLSGRIPDVSALPTDPSALAAVLKEGGPVTNPDQIPDGTNAVFERAARLAIGPDSGLSPALSASLYHVMADQPGVQLLGQTTDHQGRLGTAVGISTSSGLSEVIVDPQSGEALEAVYAPPPDSISATLPGPGSQPCSASACTLLEPGQGRLIEAPLWSDNVTSGIVASTGSTQPSSSL
jgi:hypothetical protein